MTLYCTACRVLVPASKAIAGKAVGGAIGSALGLTTKSVAGTVVAALVGLAVGHVIDEAARPICGHCGLGLSSVPRT